MVKQVKQISYVGWILYFILMSMLLKLSVKCETDILRQGEVLLYLQVLVKMFSIHLSYLVYKEIRFLCIYSLWGLSHIWDSYTRLKTFF